VPVASNSVFTPVPATSTSIAATPTLEGNVYVSKVRDIMASGADTVVTCETSCLMNVAGGLHKAGSNIRTMHVVDLQSTIT
jgi:L-lactate dehydrogenase complex protein LldE